MKSLWSILYLAVASKAQAATDSASAPAGPITVVEPYLNYTLQLDCISCPFFRDDGTWEEEDPRPNALVLEFGTQHFESVYGMPHYLYGDYRNGILLNNISFDPFSYSRRVPMLMGGSEWQFPPFKSIQVVQGLSFPEIEAQIRDTKRKPFELAYQYNLIGYYPHHEDDSNHNRRSFIEFEITGLRHELHKPGEVAFNHGETEGIKSKIRLITSNETPHREAKIEFLELVPREESGDGDLPAEDSIAGPTWGGRLPILAAGESFYTTNSTYNPADWNECGPVTDRWRQVMCKVEDFTEWLKHQKGWPSQLILTAFIILCIMLGLLQAFVLWTCYWLARKTLKTWSQREECSENEEERRGLLAGNEALEEEEEEEEEEEKDGYP